MEIAAEAVPAPKRRTLAVWGVTVLVTAVAGLFYYKWTGSFARVTAAQSGGFKLSADALTAGGVLSATLTYFSKVWIALAFGLVIGAALRALISPRWVASAFAEGGAFRRQATGGLSGMPLMLCSCCVTPVFTGVYECGAKLGAALSLMLAAPGLNIAALVLTFMLFPLQLALPRLVAAVIAVFALPALLERVFGGTLKRVTRPQQEAEDLPATAGEFLKRFVKSLGYLIVVTLPLILAGVLVSSLVLAYGLPQTASPGIVSVMIVATVAVAVALPTFFEIPLALLLLQMGAPGAAAVMLFAGPIINLPSMFVLARETKWQVAASLTGGIWVLAVAAGAVAQVL